MSKNCVLIGGSGFLGLNTARGLLEAGYRVTIADIRPPSIPGFQDVANHADFCKCDYHDAGKLKSLLKGQEVLFHLAYSSLPGSPYSKIEEDVRDNVLGAVGLFRSAAESGVRLIIFPSSGGTIYGAQERLPIGEGASTDPICSYGVTKLMIEKYLSLFNKISSVDYLIFRISNLYGPGQMPNAAQGIVANVIKNLLSDKPVTIFGKGENIRDYVYIDDVVKAFMLGIKLGLKNDLFNVSSDKGYSVNDVIKIISKITNIKPTITYSDRRPFDVASNVLDSGKLRSATGWKAETPIEGGIGNTYRWLKDYFGKQ